MTPRPAKACLVQLSLEHLLLRFKPRCLSFPHLRACHQITGTVIFHTFWAKGKANGQCTTYLVQLPLEHVLLRFEPRRYLPSRSFGPAVAAWKQHARRDRCRSQCIHLA